MGVESGLDCEASPTYGTVEGLLSGVYSRMSDQVTRLTERLITKSTSVGAASSGFVSLVVSILEVHIYITQ